MHDLLHIRKQQVLSKNFLFQQVPSKDLDALVKFSKIRHVSPKETIFNQSDLGNQLFAIVDGHVKISSVSDEGKEVVFNILSPGEIFGEMALLDGQKRSAMVTALDDGEILVIDRRDFLPFLERTPKVAINLLIALSLRMRMIDKALEDIVFLNLPSRLAKKILLLADEFGQKTDRGTLIDIKLTQQELSNMTGTSRESINKQMRAWEDKGVVLFDKGSITIVKREQLELISQLLS